MDPLGEDEGLAVRVAREPIDLLGESQRLHHGHVVAGVVVHLGGHLAVLPAFGEQTVAVEHAEPLGADDLVQPPGPRPLEERLEQGVGDLRVVDALEEVELAPLQTVMLVVPPVLDGGDAAHVLPIARGDEKVGVGVLVEGVLGLVELALHVDVEGRHPHGIVAVDLEVKADEPVHLRARPGVDLFNGDHASSLLRELSDRGETEVCAHPTGGYGWGSDMAMKRAAVSGE